MDNNPLLTLKRVGKFNAIPFDEIRLEHFMPAIEAGLEEAKRNLKGIIYDRATPTFANTVNAMGELSEVLDTAPSIYYNLMSAESDDEFKQLAQQIAPLLSEFQSNMISDPVLFERVKYVYDHRAEVKYEPEELRYIEKQYKGFLRNGALLSQEEKDKLRELDMEMSRLSPQFMQNVLGATNAWQKHITDTEVVAGIPENALKAAAFAARSKGFNDGWLFTLQYPSVMPVLNYCQDRAFRQEISQAYSSRAYNDQFDNQALVKKIASLRFQRAQMLGYKTHAHYVLEERMAHNPESVFELLDRLYTASIEPAKKELAELREYARELDGLEDLQPWDVAYYAEKLKQKKFQFDAEELRPYFKMENVVEGAFEVAKQLYGIKFMEMIDIPRYHPDVKVYKVTEALGKDIGLLYVDLFPRATKRDGAWMTSFQSQGYAYGEVHSPQVSIVGNLTPSTEETPSLLNLDEVKTIFHEFGHALHGLLSKVKLPALASPNVYWDFVELPSQIMENWVTETETLKLFAWHYQTGKLIPEELIEKVKKASTYRAASASLRQLSLGYLDMAWHAVDPTAVEDVYAYELKALEKTTLMEPVPGRNTSCSFSHIFAGGYASGYYSYKWAEVLEADAFELFKENGIFDRTTAKSFRENILAKGNTADPMELYIKFRGRQPDPDALLKRDGLK